MQKLMTILTLVLVLIVVNFSIYNKEQLLTNGNIVYLKLAPVDPRSLMQGDYMALRFDIASKISKALSNDKNHDGLVNLNVDDSGIATFSNIVDDKPRKGDIVVKFRKREGRIKIATNAYFFEEGSASQLEGAEYGEFRVNESGELLLVSLVDKHLKSLSINPESNQ